MLLCLCLCVWQWRCVVSQDLESALASNLPVFEAGFCETCDADEYLDQTLKVCTTCPHNSKTSNTPSKQLSVENCLCNAGYTKTTSYTAEASSPCLECEIGTYKNEMLANTECSLCSTFSLHMTTAATASTLYTDCLCNAGYYYDNVDVGDDCTQCPAGTYKDKIGNDFIFCLPCGDNANSAMGSDEFSDCFCNAGFSHDSGSEDTSDLHTSPDVCTMCLPGKYRTEDMLFHQTDYAYLCQDCPEDTYNVVSGSTQENDCTHCTTPTNTTNGATGQSEATACLCEKGYQKTLDGSGAKQPTCEICVAGKYSDELHVTVCTECPAGKASNVEGSTSDSTCVDCELGKFSDTPGTDTCTNCDKDQYQDSTGQIVCIECPGPTGHDKFAQSSVASCKCNVGFTPNSDNTACTECAAGTYKDDDHSNDPCTSCLDISQNSYSHAGSVSVNDCFCDAGYYATPLANGLANDASHLGRNPTNTDEYTQCKICPINSYCGPEVNAGPTEWHDDNGILGFDSCRQKSSSPSGSSKFEHCKCNAGYYLKRDQQLGWDAAETDYYNRGVMCSLCITDDNSVGYYCPTYDDEAYACGLNTAAHSDHNGADGELKLAASEPTDCVCLAGHWRNCIDDPSNDDDKVGIKHFIDAGTGALTGQQEPCTRDDVYFTSDCTPCPSDTACELEQPMQHCPLHATSPSGTSDPDNCKCTAGYKRVDLVIPP